MSILKTCCVLGWFPATATARTIGRVSEATVGQSGPRCLLLTAFSTGCFAIGFAFPFVHVAPGESLEPLTGLIVWFLTDDDTYSLFGTVTAIWSESRILGGIAFTFSVLVPLIKLILLSRCAYVLTHDASQTPSYRIWAERLGPWSMLEIFLVALTLLLSKSLALGTVIHLLPGFYFFWASVFFSLIAVWSLPSQHGTQKAHSSLH